MYEPNRWNQPEPDGETNRTEPDRAATRPKNAGRTASNREKYLSEPNRTERNRFIFEKSGTETNRTEPVPSWVVQQRGSAREVTNNGYEIKHDVP